MALSAVCGVLCCSCCKYNGNIMHDNYPRNPNEVNSLGAAWLTKVLHKNGVLESDIKVTSVRTEDNPDGGLLGEMCRGKYIFCNYSIAACCCCASFCLGFFS